MTTHLKFAHEWCVTSLGTRELLFKPSTKLHQEGDLIENIPTCSITKTSKLWGTCHCRSKGQYATKFNFWTQHVIGGRCRHVLAKKWHALYRDMFVGAIAVLPSKTWWLHQMDIFSALLAICAGNSPVTGELHEPRIFNPSGHWPETVTNAHLSAHFR